MSERQKKLLLVACCIWVLGFLLIAELCRANGPINMRKQKIDVALWLARSCVGEAGWDSVDTGECAAIAHIYHKRSYMLPKRDYFKAMIDYSVAIKPDPRRPWIRNLNRTDRRPRMLSSNTSWTIHYPKWKKTLEFADRFFSGLIQDPCPECLHFGGVMDRKRMDSKLWKRAELGFRNEFWVKR